ncbi:phosphatidylinositol-4-phosphate 5-kinase-domain-containing protein [Ochromonadaceae sp. CCMP2298]|nr:phosphatidylinositol-4-phosphate 5-kinase-domain-containing protein [Ochromonadaceae sp. CCMP2298]
MDYSLLVGVKRQNFEIINDSPESRTADDTALQAALVEGQGTFYIGIIDVLQEWDYSKWWERMFKIFALRKDGKGISAVDPLTYRRRFYQRAVLDVFDGLDAEDADDDDVFEREPLILTASNIDALNSTHIHNGHRHDIEGGTINSTLSPLRTPDLVNGVRGSTSTHTTKTSLKACAGEDASQRSASVGDQEMPPLGPAPGENMAEESASAKRRREKNEKKEAKEAEEAAPVVVAPEVPVEDVAEDVALPETL